jgi:hypothetical protein
MWGNSLLLLLLGLTNYPFNDVTWYGNFYEIYKFFVWHTIKLWYFDYSFNLSELILLYAIFLSIFFILYFENTLYIYFLIISHLII